MKPTKAQKDLLEKLADGFEVTLQDGYYTVVNSSGQAADRIWPTTFHGLFNYCAVERNERGNYVITDRGRELLQE